MRSTLTLCLFTAISQFAVAQECDDGRYVDMDHFANVTVTSAVPFGSNTGVNGQPQTLYMDVYEPANDPLTLRPAVLVAFGGSFISGTRADVAPLCTDLAKRGYVAIGYDYRVGFFLPNQTTTVRAVMRGAHDTRACVRYLRKSVAELDNPYGIDTTRIIIGGVSAGAISALHAMYLDDESEIPTQIAGEMPALGGLEGNSGNPGYSSEAMACWSMSGCLGDSSWIDEGDQALASVHEVADNIVPYYTAPVYIVGLPTGLTASGSHDLHVRADHLGLVNCFKSYPGSGHVGYLSSDPIGSVNFIARFLGEVVCGEPVTCEGANTGVDEAIDLDLAPSPNPTRSSLRVQVEVGDELMLTDLHGRVLQMKRCTGRSESLDLGGLPNGTYALHVRGRSTRSCRVMKLD